MSFHPCAAVRTSGPAVSIALLTLSVPALGQQFQDQTTTRFPAPNPTEYTNYVQLGDIDGDDDLDIIWASGGNFTGPGAAVRARLYVNDGAGNFSDETTTQTPNIAGLYRGVQFGDVDGDSNLDVILVQDFQRQPRLWMNDGAGNFTDDTLARIPAVNISSTRAAFADIDNDGDLDIYINVGGTNRFGCGQNQVWINDGDGFFTDETALRHPTDVACQPMDVIFGDIDNDFDLDVRAGNRGTGNANSRLFRNDGTGVFEDITATNIPSDFSTYSYDFGDINGDGNLDMIGANAGPGNQELLLEGDGEGNFTNVSNQISPNPGTDDNDTKFFDYDNDGDLDLIVARIGGVDRTYTNNGLGSFTEITGLVTATNDTSLDVAVADLTGDGRLDIVTAQGESGNFQNRIYINTSGPVDDRAPRIIRTEAKPDTCAFNGLFVVRATIFDDYTADRGFFDRGVQLNYTVGDGPVESVDMTWSGNSIYRGIIPGAPGGGLVEYWVTATDWAGNVGTGDTSSFTVQVLEGDPNGDGRVDADDVLVVINGWGTDGSGNNSDINGDGTVDTDDLLDVINGWGECPPVDICVGVSSQSPTKPTDDFQLIPSDALAGERRLDEFVLPAGGADLTQVRWWGAELRVVGKDSVPCSNFLGSYQITFYPNAGGPDLNNPLATYASLTPSKVDFDDYDGVTVKQFDITLPKPLSLAAGTYWISIEDTDGNICQFFWLDSKAGNGTSRIDDGTTVTPAPRDLSFCLNPPA